MPVELTLEQQFQLKRFADQVEQMDLAEAQRTLIDLYTMMLYRETIFKNQMAEFLGIGKPPSL